ncbi:uncharacterized protein LOC109540997 isoform X2 [Dendroctonus ponderosae]|uniref:uncharacterized protein LOC109540997 isoform X2 n=1 Tax=Dendroctonus ponderosae TaxID=77166 RepID=UPI00203565C0|nr:uncharacterized protein LOC109540997 isoform X2 [Dendroctonus ponderosae]
MSVCVQISSVNMASQEEDNKLECISNVNKDQERYYLNVYKRYEFILNDKSEQFEHKVQSLIDVWKSISELNFSQFDIKYIIHIIDWAKLHALNIVLTGEWRSTKESFRDSLLQCIEKAQQSLASINDAFSTRCQKLADVVKKPWEDPVLYNLIQERDAEIGSKEIEFFCVETAYLVSVRLKKLCENHCEDLALNLVTNFLKCKKQATIQNFSLNATETQLWFIFDIYMALLYKFQDKDKIFEQFQNLQLAEGVQLIKRFSKKRVKISKIWRNCHKIAIFGSRYFLSKALMSYNTDLRELLTDLLKTYLALSNTDVLLQEFVLSVRNLTNLADAEGLCVMCEIIHREAAEKLRHFAIEMYIRALTTDMNELERLKHVNEDVKMKLTTSRLAHTFSNLTDLLDDHVKVARECILTAFSLEPTKERLKRIEELAKRSGFPVLDTGQEWRCRLHPPVLPSDDLAWVCPECGEWMSKPELTAPLQMNTPLQEALQESILGISEALCDDLVVCLSNPRYQILSWLLSWGDLYRLCILYLNDPEKTKNFVTELKFVDVDYSMFDHIKREPVDEYTGIEKGYEQYLDIDFVSDEETSSVSEDSLCHERSAGLGSDGTEDSGLPLPQLKSDPNTLKSLRMFRPSLKRKKDDMDPPVKDKKISLTMRNNSLAVSRFESHEVSVTNRILPFQSAKENQNFPDRIYLPKAAEVPEGNCISTPGNFSKHDNSNQPGNSISQLQSPGWNSELGANGHITASTSSQPVNSVFNTTNLSNVTSTSYVSNIIRSSLTYGVPKITDNTQSLTPSSTYTTPRQGVVPLNAVAKKSSLKQSSSFTTSSNVGQKSNRAMHKNQSAVVHFTKSKADALQQASDLDALLKEVVQDIDDELIPITDTESKNGLAATLPQLGGQVANIQKQLIQVSHQIMPIPCQSQMKSLHEMFSPSGTSDDCKMKLRNVSNSEKKRAYSGEVLDSIKKRKETKIQDSTTLEIGEDPYKLMDLTIRIPRLNLKKHKCRPKSVGQISQKAINPIWGGDMAQDIRKQAPIRLKELTIRLRPEDMIQPHTIQLTSSHSMQPETPVLMENSPSVLSPVVSTERQILTTTQSVVPTVTSDLRVLSPIEQQLTLPTFSPTEVQAENPIGPIETESTIFPNQNVAQKEFPILPITNPEHRHCRFIQLTSDQEALILPRATLQALTKSCSVSTQQIRMNIWPSSVMEHNQLPQNCVPLKTLSVTIKLPLPLHLDKIVFVPHEKIKDVLSTATYSQGVFRTTVKTSDFQQICQQGTVIPITSIRRTSCPQNNQESTLDICPDSFQNQKAATVDCDEDEIDNNNKKTDPFTDFTETVPNSPKELEKTDQVKNLIDVKYGNLEIVKMRSLEIEQVTDWGKSYYESSHGSTTSSKDDTSEHSFTSSEEVNDHNIKNNTVNESVSEFDQGSTIKQTIDCDNKSESDSDIDSSHTEEDICDTDSTLARIDEWLKEALKWNTKDKLNHMKQKTKFETKYFCESGAIAMSNESAINSCERTTDPNDQSLTETTSNNDRSEPNMCSRLAEIRENIIKSSLTKHDTIKESVKSLEQCEKSDPQNNQNDVATETSMQHAYNHFSDSPLNSTERKASDETVVQKELRILIEREHFLDSVKYQQNIERESIENTNDIIFPKNSKITYPKRLESEKDFLFSDVFSDSSVNVDKENINKVAQNNCQPNSDEVDQRRCKSDLDYLKSCQDANPVLKRYSNNRKRKHDEVPCFKVDQEKAQNQLTVALKRLPEVIARPNVKVLVSDPFKNDEESSDDEDDDVFKRASPLADCNIRNEIKKKLNKTYNKKHNSNRRKRIRKSDQDDLGKNSGVHVNIYEDKFYSLIAKVSRPLCRSGAMNLNIPGLKDYSEILPRNVNHVVNVVQHTIPRSSSVTNQNTQTSTQVTPHIQRIGQPKLPDRKPDRYENESDQAPASSPVSKSPLTTNASTLINILSNAKPGQMKSVTASQTPFVNILSQQVLNPAVHQAEPSNPTVIKVDSDTKIDVQATKSVNTNLRIVTTTTQAGGASTASSPAQGGTILQFICKSSLPKFQQAFGKTVYQAGTGTICEGTSDSSASSPGESCSQSQVAATLETKKITAKAVPVNVQPLTGNVIFRGQVPVGQTVSLIPPGSNTRQLFRITGSTHEQINLVKETLIQNKMGALLHAIQTKPKVTVEQNGAQTEEYTKITLCKGSTVSSNTTRIVKPIQLQIPANVIRAPQPANVSSTTLEQLREFDMVYKQVKERSTSTPVQPESTSQTRQEAPQQQRISFAYVNQVQKYTQLAPVVVVSTYSSMQQSVSPALSVSSQSGSSSSITTVNTIAVPKVAVKPSKGKSISKSSIVKTSPTTVPAISKPQQKPQEDELTTQRIFDILAGYAEQLRNSPDLNNKPAPRRRSNPPTNPSSNTTSSSSSKKKKKKSSSSTTSTLVETDNEDLTMGSEDSSGGNIVQLSMTDEEQSQSASVTPTESNLEPATSNASNHRPIIVTTDAASHPRNVIIADSSMGDTLKMQNTTLLMPGNYIMPVSVVKSGQPIAVVSGGSKILTTVPTRSGQNMLLFQNFVNQSKKGAISTIKYSTLQPFSGLSASAIGTVNQSAVVLPSNSVATVALGQPITLKKIEDCDKGTNTELLLTIAPPREAVKVEKCPDIPQPDSSTSLSCETIEVKVEDQTSADLSTNAVLKSINRNSCVATSVIASVIKKEDADSETESADATIIRIDSSKQLERISSVLVNTSASNGPMLSHTNHRYRKSSEGVECTTVSSKEFNQNSMKVPQSATKILKNNAVYYAIRTKKAINKKIDSEMQKQAAMERELRLQKTLSEECEDLGVDEPSTSDLFPEADLLFDSNHSPSYDQSGQKVQGTEAKTKHSMHLFSDDENSGPLRNDLFDYVEYNPPDRGLNQVNGNNISIESTSSCDDSTLLPNCGNMAEVTLNSPISPEYSENNHNIIKYKYKYTNRKKGEKSAKLPQEVWPGITEVTSSEDTIELVKEDETPIAIQEETVINEVINEDDTLVLEQDDNSDATLTIRCPVHTLNDDNRSSRKSIKKLCSCFNGSRSTNVTNNRKRLASPKSYITNKKILLSKKR